MKEKLYTIPLMDAFKENDECPFCFIERKLEQDALDFTLGSSASYMESDIREQTDTMGFCRHHNKKMYEYGNTLGNALILKTHYLRLNKEFASELKSFSVDKQSFFSKLTKQKNDTTYTNTLSAWIARKESTCFVCDYINNTYDRYMATFFHLFRNNPEFLDIIKSSKGFCLHHFGELTNKAVTELNDSQLEEYKNITFSLMLKNLERLSEDVSWLVDKFDYRNKDADWKNSKDAVIRGMQKINGGYPGDPPFEKR